MSHIIDAAAQLASGKTHTQVPRGGIRELDLLAAAFNGMASRLALAQETSRTAHDQLEEKVLERTHKLQKLAAEDPLTSLPNRRNLSSLLNVAIERARRESRLLGVYFLDIDNFKNFNDSLGHVFGDRVLMSVANRLEEIADGAGCVARLGGDEFALVYEDAASEQAVVDMGLRLVNAFQQLVAVDDRELSVSVSVGASIYPDHQHDAEGLLRAADSALFRAKELGPQPARLVHARVDRIGGGALCHRTRAAPRARARRVRAGLPTRGESRHHGGGPGGSAAAGGACPMGASHGRANS